MVLPGIRVTRVYDLSLLINEFRLVSFNDGVYSFSGSSQIDGSSEGAFFNLRRAYLEVALK